MNKVRTFLENFFVFIIKFILIFLIMQTVYGPTRFLGTIIYYYMLGGSLYRICSEPYLGVSLVMAPIGITLTIVYYRIFKKYIFNLNKSRRIIIGIVVLIAMHLFSYVLTKISNDIWCKPYLIDQKSLLSDLK